MSAIKINALKVENVKRVKAIQVEPTPAGLTVIGGKNRQGKTSVLDAIAWALGGNRFKPSKPDRDGSVIPPHLHIKLSNGLVVERKGKNSDLKVIDPSGNKAGQALLDTFVEHLALDLPRFLNSTAKEKAQTLLRIIGVGDQLHQLEKQEQELYNKRHTIGQIADQKKKYAAEQPYYADAPKDLVSASDLIKEQQEILARNGENQRKRERLTTLTIQHNEINQQIKLMEERLRELQEKRDDLMANLEIAQKSAQDLQDESTAELEQSINDIEEINRKVRANLDKDKAEDDAREYGAQYDTLTTKINDVRQAKIDLLEGADLPLPGLSVEDGELTYRGDRWDNMSGSDQLRVAVAIIRKLNPNCGFVLIDKLEQMDLDTLTEFGAWLEAEGLQAIATRVSTGGECAVIIEDGYVAGQTTPAEKKEWKAGEF